MRVRMPLLLCVVGLIAVPERTDTPPHGDVHAAIRALTKQIARRPGAAGLYLRRGELHRIHMDWVSSEKDLRRALALDPSMFAAQRALARMFLEAGRATEAEAEVRAFLKAAPRDPDGWALLARILAGRGRAEEALAAWRSATNAGTHRTDLWIERTRAVAASGAAGAALRDLEAATVRLGRPVVLELEALALERRLARFDAALLRIRRIARAARRKTAWHLLEAEVLEQAGRLEEAHAMFLFASDTIRRGRASIRRAPEAWLKRATEGIRRTSGTRGGDR